MPMHSLSGQEGATFILLASLLRGTAYLSTSLPLSLPHECLHSDDTLGGQLLTPLF